MPQTQNLEQTNQPDEATLVFKINFDLKFSQRKIYIHIHYIFFRIFRFIFIISIGWQMILLVVFTQPYNLATFRRYAH